MEKLARKLTSEIAKALHYDDEKEQVVAYGLIAMIQTAVTVILVLLLGLIIGTPVEALIVCFSVSTLRKYSGGAHVSFIELCTLIGVIYCTVCSAVSRYLVAPLFTSYAAAVAIAVVYGLSFSAVYRLAPVDSPNKPIRTDKKKKRMKKDSLIVLSVYFVLSVSFLLLSLKNKWFASLGVSLLFGIVWQTLTLTKFGSYSIGKIDFVGSKIVGRGKEMKKL